MRWVLLAVMGCSDRPISIPDEVRHIDAPDFAHVDLSPAGCAGDCQSIGCPCVTPADCCTSRCDPTTHICIAASPPPDLAVPACQGPGDCVTSGCSCAANSDCCAGLVCLVPPGMVTGACGNSPPPPDMACTEGVQAGGVCTTTADCCGMGLVCIVPTGSVQGICNQECAGSACGGACCPLTHCCSSNLDCCSQFCGPSNDGVWRCHDP